MFNFEKECAQVNSHINTDIILLSDLHKTNMRE